jgi:ribosome-binding protein aMBF1 (putative translation factor)
VPEVARKAHTKAPIRNALGEQVRRARVEKGWSQSDLTRKLQLAGWDVERSVITKIELRRRCITDYELLILARTLGVNVNSFAAPKSDEIISLLKRTR